MIHTVTLFLENQIIDNESCVFCQNVFRSQVSQEIVYFLLLFFIPLTDSYFSTTAGTTPMFSLVCAKHNKGPTEEGNPRQGHQALDL